MQRYQSYALGQWFDGEGVESSLYNAINGDKIGEISSVGLDYAAMLEYAKKNGGKRSKTRKQSRFKRNTYRQKS